MFSYKTISWNQKPNIKRESVNHRETDWTRILWIFVLTIKIKRFGAQRLSNEGERRDNNGDIYRYGGERECNGEGIKGEDCDKCEVIGEAFDTCGGR